MGAEQHAIAVSDLEVHAHGRALLRGTRLHAHAGSVHALVGASGVGKSTLLRIIGGLDRPQKGTVRAFEHDVVALRGGRLRRYLRHDVGFVFQEGGLVGSWSARRNLRAAGAAASNRPMAAPLSIEEAFERLELRPALADVRAEALSGGEQQRVAIAQVLVRMPRLVLMDEPTAALDPQCTRVVVQLIRELADAGATVIAASHDRVLVDAADVQTSLAEAVSH